MSAQQPWAIRVAVLADQAQVDVIVDRIGAAICGEIDHPGPCTTPWEIVCAPVDDLDPDERASWQSSVEALREQHNHPPGEEP